MASPPTPILVTRDTFVTNGLTLPEGAKTLFYFFDETAVTCTKNRYTGFRNMTDGGKLILRILFYLAHCFHGKVYLVYMEPSLLANQETLSPPMRCCLTGEYCIAVVFPEMHAGCGETGSLGSPGDRNASDLDGVTIDDVERYAMDAEHAMVRAIKRLVCMDKNLTTSTMLYIMMNNAESTDTLLSTFDWITWTYVPADIHKKIKPLQGCLTKPLNAANHTAITKNSLMSAIAGYFGRGHPSTFTTSVSTDDMMRFLICNMSRPDNHPLYRRFKQAYPAAACVEFIAGATDSPAFHTTLCTKRLLVFAYDSEHLINKDDFNLFENAPLLRYPFRPTSSADAEGSVNRPQRADADAIDGDGPARAETLGSYVDCIVCGTISVDGDDATPNQKHGDFKVVWPHLRAVKSVIDELESTDPTARSDPMADLRVKVNLFTTMVVNNGARIIHEPARGTFTKIRQLMRTNGGCAFTPPCVKTSRSVRYRADPSTAPKVADHAFLHFVFVKTMGLGRNVQAYLTLLHVLHSTAPKWKEQKIMLVNFTRGGMGKSHTNDSIRLLFAKVPHLFSKISTFSDTVFKYTNTNVAKVMLLDDVGFSSAQQKNSRREDSSIASHFKSLLDVGYTVNIVSEKDDLKHGRYQANKYVAVYNVAFVWNTNTLESFSSAWSDRCIILGPEPLTAPLIPKRANDVARAVERHKLDDRFASMFVRQQLFQTLIYTLTTDAGPSENADVFIDTIAKMLNATFPTTTGNKRGSVRSDLKIMDMAMAEAVRMAITAVFEWWIPPWTKPPQRIVTGETCADYVARLDKVRVAALQFIDTAETTVEIMAQVKAFIPSSILQIAATHFNQTTENVFWTLYRFMDKALNCNAAGIFKADTDPALFTVNNANRIAPDLFIVDKAVLEMGQEINIVHRGRSVRLVEEIGPTSITLNAWFVLELYKLYAAPLLERVRQLFLQVFRSELTVTGRLSAVAYAATDEDYEVRNFLTLLSFQVHQTDVAKAYGDDGVFSIAPTFMGISTQMAIEADPGGPGLEAWGCEFPVTAEYYRGRAETDLRDVPLAERASLECVCNEGVIEWFGLEYVQKTFLYGDYFSHSRCGLFPSGDTMGFYESPSRSRYNASSWEYEDAARVYSKYLSSPHTAEQASTVVSRYITHFNAPDSPASEDPYIARLLIELPHSAEEASEVLRGRYGKDALALLQHFNDRKRQRTEEYDDAGRAGSLASPSSEPPDKMIFTQTGLDLMREIQNITGRRNQTRCK